MYGNLREYKKAKGKSNLDLAVDFDVSERTVNRLLAGDTLNRESYSQISRLTGISIENLVFPFLRDLPLPKKTILQGFSEKNRFKADLQNVQKENEELKKSLKKNRREIEGLKTALKKIKDENKELKKFLRKNRREIDKFQYPRWCRIFSQDSTEEAHLFIAGKPVCSDIEMIEVSHDFPEKKKCKKCLKEEVKNVSG